MSKIFKRVQYSDYLGENRAILDIYSSFIAGVSPTPNPTPTITPTNTSTPSPTPSIIFCAGQTFDTAPRGLTYYDNNVYVFGNFEFYAGNKSVWMAKINPQTGAIANDFVSGFNAVATGFTTLNVNALVWTTGSTFYAGGNYQLGSPYIGLNRFNADGSLDTGFTLFEQIPITGLYDIGLTNDQQGIIIGGAFNAGSYPGRIAKLTTSGNLDTTFTGGTGFNGDVYVLDVDSSNNIFVGGNFQNYKGIANSARYIAKLNQLGTIDATFQAGVGTTVTSGFSARVEDFVLKDGFLYCVGAFTTYKNVANRNVCKINATTGLVDTTFQTNLSAGGIVGVFNNRAIHYNAITNRFIITLSQTEDSPVTYNGTTVYGRMFAIDENGVLDTSYSTNNPGYGFLDVAQGTLTSSEEGITLPNGDMIFVGPFNAYQGEYMPYIVRTDASGFTQSTSDCFLPRLSQTPAVTPTQTPTPSTTSVTPTPTPTNTTTPTNTPSNTPTQTPTASVTNTPTPTPTITETPTQTPTNTATATPTPTPTITDTPTQTPTPTVTDTPTATPTPTVTDTPTQTPTVTPSITPSASPVITFHLQAENTDNILAENSDFIDIEN
jgi:hypothetical protein